VAKSEHRVQADSIGREFVDAFNRRDADGLVALSHPDIEFRPTMLAGSKRVYKGHEGLRCWVAELVASGAQHHVRVSEIRKLDDRRFLLLSEVLLDGEAVAPSAMVAKLAGGKIIEDHAYLSDEGMLVELDLLS